MVWVFFLQKGSFNDSYMMTSLYGNGFRIIDPPWRGSLVQTNINTPVDSHHKGPMLRETSPYMSSSWVSVYAKISIPCFISSFTTMHSRSTGWKGHTAMSPFDIVFYEDSLLDDQIQFVFILVRSNWPLGNDHQDQVGSGMTKLTLLHACHCAFE